MLFISFGLLCSSLFVFNRAYAPQSLPHLVRVGVNTPPWLVWIHTLKSRSCMRVKRPQLWSQKGEGQTNGKLFNSSAAFTPNTIHVANSGRAEFGQKRLHWMYIQSADRFTENVTCPKLSPWWVDAMRRPSQNWTGHPAAPVKSHHRTSDHNRTIDVTLKLSASAVRITFGVKAV